MKKGSRTINIRYIYPMQILRKHRLNIRRGYLYLVALILSFIVVLQVSNTADVQSMYGILKYSVFFLTNYFVWVFMIDYIYGAIHPINSKNISLVKILLQAFISLFILLLLHLVITNIVYYTYLILTSDLTLSGVYKDFKPFIFKSIVSRLLDVAVIVVIIKIIDAYSTIQKQQIKVISLENQLHLSQLETLRSQLDPHFLFNTLHTLNTLIGYDNEKARSMVIKVTNLLRKILDQRGENLITLEEELEYFMDYLDIEHERFHDRLDVKVEIMDEARTSNVPALILQPLIENAFKHGISLLEGKGAIVLRAQIIDASLIIELSNSIPISKNQFRAKHSTKVGLENLKNRLQQIFGENHEFLTKEEKGLFIAKLIIKTI